MHTLITLKLYTTTNCHLCEQAIDILSSIGNINITPIEIADNDALISVYGTRIPVLQRVDNLSELEWPFTTNMVKAFIK